ncbi:MAG: YciI-like protein [Candidatus Binatia bacterium]
MSTFALLYDVVDDFVARRAPLRAEHLALAQEFRARGELLMGGAFADPVDQALLVFRAPDASVVERFVARDPYVAHGLVTRWRIRPWTVAVQ